MLSLLGMVWAYVDMLTPPGQSKYLAGKQNTNQLSDFAFKTKPRHAVFYSGGIVRGPVSPSPSNAWQFQGGSFDPWGGSTFEQCAALTNHEFERVFYKNNIAAGVTIFNIYMVSEG